MAKHYVYQFYSELTDYEPKIWRRFLINGEKTVAELAYVVMIAFEMQASHLFSLRRNYQKELIENVQHFFTEEDTREYIQKNKDSSFFKNIRYELIHDDIETFLDKNERLEAANKLTINQAFSNEGIDLFLAYDFGDGWEIKLTLENYQQEEVFLVSLPRILEGEGFGIVEDVGGTAGLKHIANVLQNKGNAEYKDIVNWLDSSDLDLEKFDLEDMNFRIKKLLRVYRDSYEFRLPPTKKSIELLIRSYQGKGSRGY